MEKSINENIMPEIRLFPVLDKIVGFVGRVAALGSTTELCLSEHRRGTAEMLDNTLDQPELPFGTTIRDGGGWDDQGNYYSPYIDRSRN